MDCLFCKIAKKEISVEFIFEDDNMIAIKDINPQAPTHILVIPKRHISTLNDIVDLDGSLLGEMTISAKNLASELGISDSGYRLVWNTNRGAGQTVFHIHMHLLGGRAMTWPPG